LRPVWRGGGFRPWGLWGSAGTRTSQCLAHWGNLLLQIRHYGERRKLDHIWEGYLTIAKKGRPHNGDIGDWAAILPEEPPPVLNLKYAKQSSFGNAVWRDPEEGPHVTRPDLESALPGKNTVYPRTGGT